MDIGQTVVVSIEKAMAAVDRILQQTGPKGPNSLSTAEFRRLVAYELLASPELTQFNHALVTTTGQLFLEQRASDAYFPFPASPSVEGVLRAPLLDATKIFLEAYGSSLWNVVHLSGSIAQKWAQTSCCWYSFRSKKACNADAVHLSTQQQPYVFCRKHWSPVLRNDMGSDCGVIFPPSEANLDDWLEAIV
jgi:hypothetical protein